MTSVGDNIVPLVRGGTRDKGDDWFGVTHVEHFVRDIRLDVNKIAGLVFDDLFEPGSEFVPHLALENVEDEFKSNMDVRVSHAAGRDRGDVSRKFCRADVLGRHALFIMDAVPVTARTAAANGEDSAVVFDRTRFDLVALRLHVPGIVVTVSRRT